MAAYPLTGSNKKLDEQTRLTRKMVNRARMDKMGALLIQGYNLTEIAKELDLPYNRVYTLKRRFDERMKKLRERDIETLRDMKLLEYAWIKRQMIEQWEASKKDSKGNVKPGNVVYMDRYIAVQEAERKLLGLDTPIAKESDGGNDTPMFDWRSLVSGNSITVNLNGHTNNAPIRQEAIQQADNIGRMEMVRKLEEAQKNPPLTEQIHKDYSNRIEELERRKALREEKREMEREIEDREQKTIHKRLVIKAKSVPFSQDDSGALGME